MTGDILLIGSEYWSDRDRIICGLSDASARIPHNLKCRLVRNSYADGAAKMAADVWQTWVRNWPGQFTDAVLIPPNGDITAGIALAVTFICELSGPEIHEARAVRAAGIPVLDFGISTADETEAAA